MADYPQGTFEYSGGITLGETPILGGWSVTLTHGITPNSFTLRVPMVEGASPPEKNGDVTLRYGSNKITLKDCTIDRIEQDVGGELVWNVTFLDRRYLWRFGQIGGAYNVRWRGGTDVREDTKKKPSELAELCLQQMYRNADGDFEEDYDVSALKDFDEKDWPEIDWNVDNPAQALQALCERYELRPILDWQKNRVVIVRPGHGKDLDLEGSISQYSGTFDPPEKPGKIVLLCGYSSVQYDFPLEEVALDADGRIRYPNELSYAPKAPEIPAGAKTPDLTSGTILDTHWAEWANYSSDFIDAVSIPAYRSLAEATLLRWYRIVPPKNMKGLHKIAGDAQNNLKLGDFGSIAEDTDRSWLSQIILQSDQNDRINSLADPLATEFDKYDKQLYGRNLPAWVYGVFLVPGDYRNNLPDDPVAPDGKGVPLTGITKLNPAKVFSQQQQGSSTLPNQDVPAELQEAVVESGFYPGGFSVDAELGVVKFSEAVEQLVSPVDSAIDFRFADGSTLGDELPMARFPATLFLRTRFFVADVDTRDLIRYQKTRVLDSSKDTVRYVRRDDLTYKLTYRFDATANGVDTSEYPPKFEPTKTEDNRFEIDDACDAYLDQILDEYEVRKPETVVYPGLLEWTLDGAIQQVTWQVDSQGFAFTRVSRDCEELHIVRDYGDRRLAERLKSLADKAKQDRQPPRIAGTFTGRVHVRHNSFWGA